MTILQALTIAVGPSRGVRGAGCNDLSSLKWLNGIKVRGTTALQISEAEALKDPNLLRQCLKHSVNRQLFSSLLEEKVVKQITQMCPWKCCKDQLCASCDKAVKKMFQQQASSASAWTAESSEVNWQNVHFPSGVEDFETFTLNNPNLCLSIYRATEDKGDVFLFYRSELGDIPRSQQKMIHIVSVTRLNTEMMELETHFLPVTNLDSFCGLIYEYDSKNGNIKTQYARGKSGRKKKTFQLCKTALRSHCLLPLFLFLAFCLLCFVLFSFLYLFPLFFPLFFHHFLFCTSDEISKGSQLSKVTLCGQILNGY